MTTISDIQIQLDRLHRHYINCVNSQDLISLLDLNHSLRIWDDIKTKLVVKDIKEFNRPIFSYTPVPKPICSIIRNNYSIISIFSNDPFTSANNGTIVSGGKIIKDKPFYLSANARINNEKLCIVNDFIYLESIISPSEREIIKNTKRIKSKSKYDYWMKTEIVRVYNYNNNNLTTISREMIVQRLANAFGASHPLDDNPEIKQIDLILKELFNYEIGGLKLPYFILMSIAKEILVNVPKIIGLPEYINVKEKT